MYVALLDTCALWPSRQRDFLLSLAVANVFTPVWSDVTLEELEFHEAGKLRDRGEEAERAAHRAAQLIQTMRQAFSGATIDTWERVRPVGLPDADDEHVVAAAVIGGADVIVTDNLRDFPDALLPGTLRAIVPARFIDEMVVAQPAEASEALRSMADRLIDPPLDPADLIDLLEMRYGISAAADVLRDWNRLD